MTHTTKEEDKFLSTLETDIAVQVMEIIERLEDLILDLEAEISNLDEELSEKERKISNLEDQLEDDD